MTYMSNGTLAAPQLGFGNVSKTGSARAAARTNRSTSQVPGTKGLPAVKAVAGKESKKGVKPFPTKQSIVLCNSVAAMLDAQIPLPRALEFYNARLTRADLKQTLKSIAAAVDRGDDNQK